MAIQLFTISIQDNGSGVEALNSFLGSHKILSVDRRLVEQGTGSFWCFCVDYLAGSTANDASRVGSGKNRIDYRETLAPADFAVFSKLRDERKVMAAEEGGPVYTIFTNEQLAQMVQQRASTKADLEKIAGVGDSRIEKYGERILTILKQAWTESHEKDGKPV